MKKKHICLLLVLFFLLSTMSMSVSADITETKTFTATAIPSFNMSTSAWMSTETFRCTFIVLSMLEVVNAELVDSNSFKFDISKDMYIACDGDEIACFCGLSTNNSYVSIIYNNRTGTGEMLIMIDVSSLLVELMLGSLAENSYYKIDKSTFTTVLANLANL